MAVGSYLKCKRYIDSHSIKAEPAVKRQIYPCITITRETGAGAASSVCKELVEIA